MSPASRYRDFLDGTGWEAATAHPLAGDASGRRYWRLTSSDGRSVVLMDATAEPPAQTQRFSEIATLLAEAGLSTPQILHSDLTRGVLLLEDFGDQRIADGLENGTLPEAATYHDLARLTPRLSAIPTDLPLTTLDPQEFLTQAGLYRDHYLATDPAAGPAEEVTPFFERVAESLHSGLSGRYGLAHRDYHVENILWLPDRAGLARYGLIDFQDAVFAPVTYDLASLLSDARRDISPETRAQILADAPAMLDLDADTFALEFALCTALRNLRILGIFARLAKRLNKPRYLSFVPRVWDHVDRAFTHPDLQHLQAPFRALSPRPDPAALKTFNQPAAPA